MDIQSIFEYLNVMRVNKGNAEKIIGDIYRTCDLLKTNPLLGVSITAMTGRDTDYRYIVKGRYLIFYRVENRTIKVVRVIDGRRDYATLIFDEE